MAKPDGRIEKGQRLSTAISARRWNDLCDAADIVQGRRSSIVGTALSQYTLPCFKATFREKGYFGQVKVLDEPFVKTLGVSGDMTPADLLSPTGPASMTTLSQSTDEEKSLLNFSIPWFERTGSSTQGLQGATNFGRISDVDKSFAICVGNDSPEYAISGFAITRVRVFHYGHRYARIAGDTGSGEALSVSDGMLDSCFYGAARIVGYAAWASETSTSGDPEVIFRHVPLFNGASGHPVWPNYQVRWALVKF